VEYVVSQPPVLARRDYAAKTSYWIDAETGVYQSRFETANAAAPPAPSGVERMREVSGSWLLEPLNDGTTHAVYTFHTDPGGWVPTFLVNTQTADTVPPMMRALEKRARDPTWRLPR